MSDKSDYIRCDRCGSEILSGDAFYIDGDYICEYCYDSVENKEEYGYE